MSILRQELDSMIASALAAYDEDVRARWERIRIEPEEWQCRVSGDVTEWFWVVAIDDGRALWFNEIEEGFNWSEFSTPGTLDSYWCDQVDFATILEGFAQENSAIARARLAEGNVPLEAVGPGAIVRRQTTYWDVRTEAGFSYRIHFRDKVELAFATAVYPSIEVTSQHPLLVKYSEPIRSLYFSGTPLNPRSVAETLERTIRDMSASWRGLDDYETSVEAVEGLLRAGHGMLMLAPESACAVMTRELEANGVRCSIVGSTGERRGQQALLLGRSYVIAAGFAFEARPVGGDNRAD